MSQTLDSCHKMGSQKYEDSKILRNSGVTKVCLNTAVQLSRNRLIGMTFLLRSEKVVKKGKKTNQFPSSEEKRQTSNKVLGFPSKIMLLYQSCGTQKLLVMFVLHYLLYLIIILILSWIILWSETSDVLFSGSYLISLLYFVRVFWRIKMPSWLFWTLTQAFWRASNIIKAKEIKDWIK